MKTIAEFDDYNERRYSKPWMAKLSLKGEELQFNFCGLWTGDKKGSAGKLMAVVNDNDVIAYGQKDTRGNNSYMKYATFNNNEKQIITKEEAITLLCAQQVA